MTPFNDALSALADLSISGISANLAINTIPNTINRGQLPALLVLPVTPDNDTHSVFGERGDGFAPMAFADGTQTVTYTVTHLLLVTPTSAGGGLRAHLPALVPLIDAYFSAFTENPMLNDTLREAARVRVEPAILTYGDVEYVGCVFRHTWHIGY